MAYQLPESIVDTLLDKLGNDDVFRFQFAADPRAALAALGFEAAADGSIQNGIWNCLQVTELATKEVVRASHALLREQLSRKGVFYAFSLQGAVARVKRVA
jgi:putative modified peptide